MAGFLKSGTGKGILDGLGDTLEELNKISDIENININLLVPSKDNFYEIGNLEELQEDIKEYGLYDNLVVKKIDGDKYRIISGHRRYNALKNIGYKGNIPCRVVDENPSDVDVKIMMIKANKTARTLDEGTIRKQIQMLTELYKAKRKSGSEKVQGAITDIVGKDIGLSGSQVKKYNQINKKAIPEIQDALDKKEINVTNAFDISTFSEEQQRTILEMIRMNVADKNTTIEKLGKELDKSSDEMDKIRKLNQELNSKVEDIDTIKRQIEEEADSKNQQKINLLNYELQKAENEKKQIIQEKQELANKLINPTAAASLKEKNEVDIEIELVAKNITELTKKLSSALKKINYKPGKDVKRLLDTLKENEIKKLISEIDKSEF